MQTNNDITALVLFASEQVWPNLLSIAWYHAQGGLERVFVYYTDDKLRSAEPARRIKSLCEVQFPGIDCILPDAGLPMAPESVVAQLQGWRQKYPEVTRWVVNATGGTKLMFSGAINSLLAWSGAEAAPHWEVIYREQVGGWYSLQRDEQGLLLAEKESPNFIPQQMLNNLPILRLISTQYQGAGDVKWTQADSSTFTVITEDQFDGMLANGDAMNWNWKELFNQQEICDEISSGFAFERFLAAAIHLLGVPVRQIGLNVKAVNTDTGKEQQEIDVIVNKDGRLIVFDCKLLDETREQESFITHLAALQETVRMLGGLNAQSVLVRPNRVTTKDEMLIAEAWRVKLLGWQECKKLFSELGSLLGIEVPAQMQLLQDNYLDTDSPRPPFSQIPPDVEKCADIFQGNDAQILDYSKVQRSYAEITNSSNTQWVAYKIIDNIWVFSGPKPDGVAKDCIKPSMEKAISDYGTVIGVHTSKKGNSWYSLVGINTQNEKQFREWLRARKSKRLF